MRAAAVLIVGFASICFVATASARVDRVVIKSRQPFANAKIGPYVKVTGTFIGTLDPGEAIRNLVKARRRPGDRVEHLSEFIIIAPDRAIDNITRWRISFG